MHQRIIFAISVLLSLSTLSGVAFAHGTENHSKSDGVQMKKLHAMMPMFSEASAKLESALEKDDITAAEKQANRIHNAFPDLKKSKPHKNIAQRHKFVELAHQLDKAVMSTIGLAKKGDLAGAKVEFKKIEEACALCHAKFR